MNAPALRIEDLRYTYPDGHQALLGVDLVVDRGERVAMLGPNGAGKTTLALHLNGLREPDSGTIQVSGLTVADPNLREIRRRVGLVFQDANDQLFMPTVAEDVAFGPANLGVSGTALEERVTEALTAVGGSELAPRVPHHLSGGERRRSAIATVLAMEPEILVLDEPTAGLDPAGRRDLIELLRDLPVTQLIITHDLPLAFELCPRSVLIDEGRIVADGETAGILGDAELLAAHGLELPYRFAPDTTG